jgi:hypothetical protein
VGAGRDGGAVVIGAVVRFYDGAMVPIAKVRKDGWPICPRCGEDELASFEMPPSPETVSMCYRCGNLDVLAPALVGDLDHEAIASRGFVVDLASGEIVCGGCERRAVWLDSLVAGLSGGITCPGRCPLDLRLANVKAAADRAEKEGS